MDAVLLLCDHADAVGGKLYVNGGGWNQLLAPGQPVSVSLAILVEVPWDEAEAPHALRVELLTADGDPVMQGDVPVMLSADLAVGRPPGLKPGTTLNTPIAMRLDGLTLAVGSYEFRLFIDGEPTARRPFQVLAPG